MNLEQLEIKVRQDGYKDQGLIHFYIERMVKENPDEEVPINARTGSYLIPRVDGGFTTDAREQTYVKNPQTGDYSVITNVLTWGQNLTFFDVLKIEHVGHCRLHAMSVRFEQPMQIMDTCDDVIPKLINSHVAGFWRFSKHGKQYYVHYLGDTPCIETNI